MAPTLGVNPMWTERNDHAPKSECADFFSICPKRTVVKILKFDHSLVFSCLHFSSLLKNISLIIIITLFLYHGLLLFSTKAPLLPLPPQTCWIMIVDNVGLKICFWGPWTPWSLLTFFPWINQSSPGRSSITNHKFYKALGWLHGPWCKRPLRCCTNMFKTAYSYFVLKMLKMITLSKWTCLSSAFLYS